MLTMRRLVDERLLELETRLSKAFQQVPSTSGAAGSGPSISSSVNDPQVDMPMDDGKLETDGTPSEEASKDNELPDKSSEPSNSSVQVVQSRPPHPYQGWQFRRPQYSARGRERGPVVLMTLVINQWVSETKMRVIFVTTCITIHDRCHIHTLNGACWRGRTNIPAERNSTARGVTKALSGEWPTSTGSWWGHQRSKIGSLTEAFYRWALWDSNSCLVLLFIQNFSIIGMGFFPSNWFFSSHSSALVVSYYIWFKIKKSTLKDLNFFGVRSTQPPRGVHWVTLIE